MGLTYPGYLLIPIAAALFLWGRSTLFKGAILSLPFVRIQVANFPGYTMNLPTLFILLLMMRNIIDMGLRQGHEGVRMFLSPEKIVLLLFLVAAVISIMMPLTFAQGELVNPHEAIHESPENRAAYPREIRQVPLEFTLTNVTQLCYLILFGGAFWVFSREISSIEDVILAMKLVLIAGLLQLVSGYIYVIRGLLREGYLADLLTRFLTFFNPNFVRSAEMVRYDIPIMYTFTGEPGPSTYFLLFPFCLLLMSLAYGDDDLFYGRTASLLFLSLLLLGFSFGGTTGLVGLALLLVSLFVLAFRVQVTLAIRFFVYTIILVVLLIPVISLFFAIELEVFREYLVNFHLAKVFGEAGSGPVRLIYARLGWRLALKYPLFGVGWGSNRAPSLLPVMLGNLGFIGTGLFFWFNGIIFSRTVKAYFSTTSTRHTLIAHGFVGLLASMLVAGALARPVALLHSYFWYPLLLAMMSKFSMEIIKDSQGE